MFGRLAEASMSLDIGTLFVIAICVTSLLGCSCCSPGCRIAFNALAWWGVAYLIGGLVRHDLAAGRRGFAAAAGNASPMFCCSSRSA